MNLWIGWWQNSSQTLCSTTHPLCNCMVETCWNNYDMAPKIGYIYMYIYIYPINPIKRPYGWGKSMKTHWNFQARALSRLVNMVPAMTWSWDTTRSCRIYPWLVDEKIMGASLVKSLHSPTLSYPMACWYHDPQAIKWKYHQWHFRQYFHNGNSSMTLWLLLDIRWY